MSTHPNAILQLNLKPDATSRKTLRAILEDAGLPPDHDGQIEIGDQNYSFHVFEEGYEDSYQIAGNEGDIAVFNYLTYGYGEQCEWAEVEREKNALEAWAKGVCERHGCTFKILITANYW